MENTNAWKPGRPWALDLLTLIIVIAGVVAPIYYGLFEDPPANIEGVSAEELSFMKTRAEQQSGKVLIWAGAALFGYIGILVVASSSLDQVSPPFPYLFAPLIFSLLLYFGLLSYGKINPQNLPWLTGSAVQIIAVVLAAILMTALLARLQMSVVKKKLSHLNWEIEKASKFSGTYFSELAALFHPLVYPPRKYSACPEGLLIEGLFFVMPLPFRTIQHISRPQAGKGVAATGIPLATSTEEMIKIQTTESRKPLFISPVDRDAFYEYIDPHITRHKLTLESEKEKAVKATSVKKDYPDRPMPKKSAVPMHTDEEDEEEHTVLMDIMSSNLGLGVDKPEVEESPEEIAAAASLEKTIAVEPIEPTPPPEDDGKGILSDLTEEEIEKAAQENDPFADIVLAEAENEDDDEDVFGELDEGTDDEEEEESDVEAIAGVTSVDDDIFADEEDEEDVDPLTKPKPAARRAAATTDDEDDDIFGSVSDDDFSTVVMSEDDDEEELAETMAREAEETLKPDPEPVIETPDAVSEVAEAVSPVAEEPSASEDERDEFDTISLDTSMEELEQYSLDDDDDLLAGLEVTDAPELDGLIGSDTETEKE